MRVRVTERVDSHHTNPNYKCIIVEFLKEDNNLRIRNHSQTDVLIDWLSTDEELIRICKVGIDLSPTFKQKLESFLNKGLLL
jgi:hypothetical protein